MRINRKIVTLVASAILLAVAIYTGLVTGFTLAKAIPQPYLEAGATRYDFFGFYLLAIIYGAVCLVSFGGSIALLISSKPFHSHSPNAMD